MISIVMRAATQVTTEKSHRRRHPRPPVNRPARIRVAAGPSSLVQLMDVSAYGASLFYSSPLAIGTPVRLKFYLRTSPKTAVLKLEGTVCESQLRGESHLIRIRFTRPPLEAIKVIYEYARQKLEPDH